MNKLIIALSLAIGTSQAMPWEIGQTIESPLSYDFHGKAQEELDVKIGDYIGFPKGSDSEQEYIVGVVQDISGDEILGMMFTVTQNNGGQTSYVPSEETLKIN